MNINDKTVIAAILTWWVLQSLHTWMDYQLALAYDIAISEHYSEDHSEDYR